MEEQQPEAVQQSKRQIALGLLKEYPYAPLGLVFVLGALAYLVAQVAQLVVNAVQHPSLLHIAAPIGFALVLHSVVTGYWAVIANRKGSLIKAGLRLALFFAVVGVLLLMGVR